MNKLYIKASLALIALLSLSGLFLMFVAVPIFHRYSLELTQAVNKPVAEHVAHDLLSDFSGITGRLTIPRVFDSLMTINPSIEFYVLDPAGKILFYSAPPGRVQLEKVDLDPVRQYLRGEGVFPILGDDPRHPEQRKAFSAAEMKSNGEVSGYLYAILGSEILADVRGQVRPVYLRMLVGSVAAFSLLFATGSGLLIFYLFTRKLTRLTAEVDRFRQVRFSDTVADGGNSQGDELQRLESTFHQMERLISEQFRRLEIQDQTRRRLVANVSHDLRTPMMSLLGYLETLLMKNQTLSPDQRREYIEIALRSGQRLKNLAENLFELATLELKETAPKFEPFSISELIRDVLQYFQLPAQKKSLEIAADLEYDLPFVIADVGLIERVMNNLLENALRYTPHGGWIRITLTPMNDRIEVCISNNGPLISREEIELIFEPFYQIGDRDREGTGLGLTIVKTIIDLHRTDIHAEALPEGGLLFRLTLPIS